MYCSPRRGIKGGGSPREGGEVHTQRSTHSGKQNHKIVTIICRVLSTLLIPGGCGDVVPDVWHKVSKKYHEFAIEERERERERKHIFLSLSLSLQLQKEERTNMFSLSLSLFSIANSWLSCSLSLSLLFLSLSLSFCPSSLHKQSNDLLKPSLGDWMAAATLPQ